MSLSRKCLKSIIKGNLIHQSACPELMWQIISCWFIILMLGKKRELCLMRGEVRPGLGPQKAAGINSQCSIYRKESKFLLEKSRRRQKNGGLE